MKELLGYAQDHSGDILETLRRLAEMEFFSSAKPSIDAVGSYIKERLETARGLAAPLGTELKEAHGGGGSDGQFAAAMGIPVLDGLGGVGEGPHADHEHVIVAALPERVGLLASLLVGK